MKKYYVKQNPEYYQVLRYTEERPASVLAQRNQSAEASPEFLW